MSRGSTDLSWQKGAICALPENKGVVDFSFLLSQQKNIKQRIFVSFAL
jgi:hypothetical protein